MQSLWVKRNLWEPIYKISENELDNLCAFLCEPGIYTYAKSEVAGAIEQIVHHNPKRKNEVVTSLKKVLAFFSACDIEANVVDSDLIRLMICDAIHINATELLPEIKTLFDKGYVSTGICGNYREVENDIKVPPRFNYTKEILSITDRYRKITSEWFGYQSEDDNPDLEDDFFVPTTPIVNQSNIGRNDPCPCGSGKKYKKCCLP